MHPDDVRLQAVARARAGIGTIPQIAEDLGVNASDIFRWAADDGDSASEGTDLDQLRTDVHELQRSFIVLFLDVWEFKERLDGATPDPDLPSSS